MIIKIGPINYTIEKITKERFRKIQGEEDYIGLANHKDSKILLLNGMSPQFSNLVLAHEIVHAIASVYGLEVLQENENAVQALAVAIVELIKNNPWFAKRIMAK